MFTLGVTSIVLLSIWATIVFAGVIVNRETLEVAVRGLLFWLLGFGLPIIYIILTLERY